ncbi:MAG: periplasmic heavy metal sensor [Sphingomonas sp.]|nr:periplasmic heavy metal sensor [Sphingomonas sp.]
MKQLSILAALAIAGAATIATAQAPSAPAAKPQQAPAAPRKIPGVSDEGNAILQKAQSTPDPLVQQLATKVRSAHDQLMSAVMAPVIDPDKVEAAMKTENDVQTQIREHNTDRLIAVLKSLPSDDRGTFLRTLILSRQQRPAAQANPPAATPKP